jgi:WD40 repeat protein
MNRDHPMKIEPAKTHIAKELKHTSPLVSCRFDPTGKYVFFGAEDSRVWRWDIATNTKVELAGHDSWVRGMAFHSAGHTLVTGGYDGQLIWWSTQGDKPALQRKINAHQGWIRAVAISPDNQLVASVGNDLVVRLWSFDQGTLVREMKGHESHIYNVAFHPGGKRLLSGDLKANLLDWDVATGKQQRSIEVKSLYKYDKGFMADIGGMRAMAFNRDGSLVGCAGITNVTNAFAGVGNPCIELLDWETGKSKTQHLSKNKLRGVAWGVVLHDEKFTVGVSGGSGGYMLFWKFDAKEEFHQLKLPNTARDLALSPSGHQLAIAHHDGHVRLAQMTAKKAP